MTGSLNIVGFGRAVLGIGVGSSGGMLATRHDLTARFRAHTPPGGDPNMGSSALEWALSRLNPAAAGRQPAGTLVLRSDARSPGELADEVMDAVHGHGFGQAGDREQPIDS